MKLYNIHEKHAFRVVVGLTVLVFLMVGVAGATKSIKDNATGGDCTSIGTWNVASKTCTLTTDLTESIEIDSDGITLNGNGHTITGSSTGNGIYLSGRNGATIKNTNVREFLDGIYLDSSSNNTLSGNIASNNNRIGIRLYNSNNNTLSGNNVNSNFNYGILLESGSNNNTLSANNVSKNGFDVNSNDNIGIYITMSDSNTLSGNNVNSTSNYGIVLGSRSNNNILSANNVSNNDFIGIVLESNDNTLLSGNNVSNNGRGIFLEFSNNNMLSGNNVNSNNEDYGIWLYDSSNNTLSANNVWNNKLSGILISSLIIQSSNNLVYNNIFNNTNNVQSLPSHLNNFYTWNITEQSSTNIIGGPNLGGNFWANPSGTGFSQTCKDANGDGICDSPYGLDTDNVDYLPLSDVIGRITPPTPPPPAPELPTIALMGLGMLGLLFVVKKKK